MRSSFLQAPADCSGKGMRNLSGQMSCYGDKQLEKANVFKGCRISQCEQNRTAYDIQALVSFQTIKPGGRPTLVTTCLALYKVL